MIFAVMLSVFLLFSVFTVGATYLKMQKLQNIRLNGGLLYVTGVVCLTLTVGLAITYGVYRQMNYMGAEFWFPTIYFFVRCWLC